MNQESDERGLENESVNESTQSHGVDDSVELDQSEESAAKELVSEASPNNETIEQAGGLTPEIHFLPAPECRIDKGAKIVSALGVLLIPLVIAFFSEKHTDALANRSEEHKTELQERRLEYQRLVDARAQFNLPVNDKVSESDKAINRELKRIALEDLIQYEDRLKRNPVIAQQIRDAFERGDLNSVKIAGSPYGGVLVDFGEDQYFADNYTYDYDSDKSSDESDTTQEAK